MPASMRQLGRWVSDDTEIVPAGKFMVASPYIVVSDPCYDLTARWRGKISKVENGEWSSYLIEGKNKDLRVGLLIVLSGTTPSDVIALPGWQEVRGYISVDSGTLGFYDGAEFPRISAHFHETIDTEGWYEQHKKDNYTIRVPYGVASSTCFGDGLYPCYYLRNEKKKVYSAFVDFICCDPEEED